MRPYLQPRYARDICTGAKTVEGRVRMGWAASVAAGVASRSGADDAALGDGIAAAGLISHNYLTANASERAVFDAWLSSSGPQGSGPKIGGE